MAKQRNHGIRRMGLVVVLFLLFLLSLLFYTIENTKPHELAMGVVSLDEGDTEYNTGSNLGDEMVSKLVSGEYANAMFGDGYQPSTGSYTIEFKRYDSEEEVQQAIDNDDVYGSVVIPRDYTADMLSGDFAVGDDDGFAVGQDDGFAVGDDKEPGASGSAGSRSIVGRTARNVANVVLDAAQNPAVSQAAEEAVKTSLAVAGLDAFVEPSTLNVDDAQSIPAPLFHALLLIPPLVAGIVLGALYKIRRGYDFSERLKRFGITMLLNAAASLALAILVYMIIVAAIRFSAAPVPSILYLWILDFLLMTFMSGLSAINTGMALIVAAVFLMLGGVLGLLPFETFPPMMQNLAFPWLTTTFTDWNLNTAVADGIGPWVQGLSDIWVYALVGIIAALIAASFATSERRADK